jgi:hypothetical protein
VSKGPLSAALARRSAALAACEGIPTRLLAPGCVLKLSTYLRDLETKVQILEAVRELQAAKIRELGGAVTKGDGAP